MKWFLRAALCLLVLTLLAIMPGRASALSGPAQLSLATCLPWVDGGAWPTQIQLASPGAAATYTVNFYSISGVAVGTPIVGSLGAYGGAIINATTQGGLPSGAFYAVVNSDQPIVVMAYVSQAPMGAVGVYRGEPCVRPGTQWYGPYFVQDGDPFADSNLRLANSDAVDSSVNVTFYELDGTQAHSISNLAIPAMHAVDIRSDELLAAQTVPGGEYWAKVEPAGGAVLGVLAIERSTGELMFRGELSGPKLNIATRVNVKNSSNMVALPSAPAGAGGAPAGSTNSRLFFGSPTMTDTVSIFFYRPDGSMGASPITAGIPQNAAFDVNMQHVAPPGSYSVLAGSSGPLVGTALEYPASSSLYAIDGMMLPGFSASTVAPVMHMDGIESTLVVQNVSGASTQATVAFYSLQGALLLQLPYSINPGAAATINLELAGLPVDFAGTALVSAGAGSMVSGWVTVSSKLTAPALAPVTRLTLSAPQVMRVGEFKFVTATAAPITATLPITFGWEVTGWGAVERPVMALTDGIEALWSSSGVRRVTVTASNAVGPGVSASQTITVVTESGVVSPTQGAAVNTVLAHGNAEVDIPAGAVKTQSTLGAWTLYTPGPSDQHSAAPAGIQLLDLGLGFAALQDGAQAPDLEFDVPVTLTIVYSPSVVAGVDPETLSIWRQTESGWEDAAKTCTPASTYVHNAAANLISIAVCETGSVYRLSSNREIIFAPYTKK